MITQHISHDGDPEPVRALLSRPGTRERGQPDPRPDLNQLEVAANQFRQSLANITGEQRTVNDLFINPRAEGDRRDPPLGINVRSALMVNRTMSVILERRCDAICLPISSAPGPESLSD